MQILIYYKDGQIVDRGERERERGRFPSIIYIKIYYRRQRDAILMVEVQNDWGRDRYRMIDKVQDIYIYIGFCEENL